jgi:hypothetical protein
MTSLKKDCFPLPGIDTLDTLAGAKCFSELDLKSGYWQAALHPDNKEKTAFSTGQATFERLMESVLRGQINDA